MNTTDFYKNLTAFQEFKNTFDPTHYHKVPEDWLIAISDIKESTKAIQRGRYKDVNVVGASSIIAVLNEIGKKIEIPYVFGGDGASFLLPPSLIKPVAKALIGTQDMAKEAFDMDLRVSLVPLSEIKDSEKSIRVAKYKMSQHVSIAMFTGGGLAFADQLIKEQEEKYDAKTYLETGIKPEADFDGLECRWNPVRTKKGDIITLMVQSTQETSNESYDDFLNTLSEIYGVPDQYRPNHSSDMSLNFKTDALNSEHGVHTYNKGFIGKALYAIKMGFEILLGTALFKWNLTAAGVEGPKYIDDLIANTDFQKFDDTLRMVIDSSPGQTEKLKTYLDDKHASGELYYGLHITNDALVTCLIFDRNENHLHFIDGGKGGYAIAAKQMKQQIREK